MTIEEVVNELFDRGPQEILELMENKGTLSRLANHMGLEDPDLRAFKEELKDRTEQRMQGLTEEIEENDDYGEVTTLKMDRLVFHAIHAVLNKLPNHE